jgi:protein phosphatase
MSNERNSPTEIEEGTTAALDVDSAPIAPGVGETTRENMHVPGVGGLSDVGRVRELNEDNWHWAPLDGDVVLYAVADGMGGHDRGEVAAAIAVESLFKQAGERLHGIKTRDLRTLRDLFRDSMQGANRAVVTAGEEQDSNMGTTLCAAMTFGGSDALIANVGDSRAYLVRESKMYPISQDHSLVAYLVQLGELTTEEARNHPSGNILVRSIGSVPEVEIDMYHLEIQAGDRLMLCSDGLWGELPDDRLLEIMNEYSNPDECCRALVDAANDSGGRDNSTLIVVNV